MLLFVGNWKASACACPRACKQEKYHRSEEHTSELQSRQYLVCRLLLEKKKKYKKKKKIKKKTLKNNKNVKFLYHHSTTYQLDIYNQITDTIQETLER